MLWPYLPCALHVVALHSTNSRLHPAMQIQVGNSPIFAVEQQLGKGGFGAVYKGRRMRRSPASASKPYEVRSHKPVRAHYSAMRGGAGLQSHPSQPLRSLLLYTGPAVRPWCTTCQHADATAPPAHSSRHAWPLEASSIKYQALRSGAKNSFATHLPGQALSINHSDTATFWCLTRQAAPGQGSFLPDHENSFVGLFAAGTEAGVQVQLWQYQSVTVPA